METVYILFTNLDETLAAARVANALATAMAASLMLVVLRPLSMRATKPSPALDLDAFGARLQAEGITARPRVFVSRDERYAVARLFTRPSLFVMAGRRRWWPTRSDRWRRMLETAGHLVVFVQSDGEADYRTVASA